MGNGCCSNAGRDAKTGAGANGTSRSKRDKANASTDAESDKDERTDRAMTRRFSDTSALRQRENEINRLNPTDRMDQWKEKLLMDITTDPLAVFRDFPRMKVTVTPSSTTPSPASIPSATAHTEAKTARSTRVDPTAMAEANPLADPPAEAAAENTAHAADDGTRLFQERNARVLETVLQLAALCGEAATFGAAFEDAWRCREEENAIAYAEAQALQRPSRGGEGGADEVRHASSPPLPSATGRAGPYEVAEVLDVHQLLQHACLASGMLVATPQTSTASPPGTNDIGTPRGGSPMTSTVKRSRIGASTVHSSLVDASHAPYGGTGSSSKRQRQTTPMLSTTSGAGAVTYSVRSVTFHVMQFMVQGVMFFPMQRFRHVLWTPWATQYRDIDWHIHVSTDVVSERAYQALLAHRQRWQTVARAGVFPSAPPPDAILQEPGSLSGGAGGAGGASSGSVLVATGSGAATAAMHISGTLSHVTTPRQSSTPRLTGPGLSSSVMSHRTGAPARTVGAAGGSGNLSRLPGSTPGSEIANEDGPAPLRRVLRVQHLQTVRNYVEDDQRRGTPAMELQLSCTIGLDLPFTTRLMANPSASFARQNSPTTVPTSSGAYDSSLRRTSRQSSAHFTPSVDHGRSDSHGIGGGGGPATSKVLEEVIDMSLKVLCAFVEAPKKKLFIVSGDWKDRREEFAYVLSEQFDVDLVEVKELSKTGVYA